MRRFALTQILKGRSAMDGWQVPASEPEERRFDMHVVDVNRTVKVTKGGSLQRFSALVVVGNGNGVVGWAMGKAPEVGVAIEKAYARASRSLFYFERFEGHTIFHDTSAKYGRSIVNMAPLPSGSGVKANQTVRAIKSHPRLWLPTEADPTPAGCPCISLFVTHRFKPCVAWPASRTCGPRCMAATTPTQRSGPSSKPWTR